MKYFLLFGDIGAGKSSVGNSLLNEDVFDVGENTTDRCTQEIKIALVLKRKLFGDLTIIDTPGIGKTRDEKQVFHRAILNNKEVICKIDKVDAFVLVVKFNNDQASSFVASADEFVKLFSVRALSSLVVLCIQVGTKRYGINNFDEVIKNSNGYKHLAERFGDKIEYCLWDNVKPFRHQEEKLNSIVSRLDSFPGSRLESLLLISDYVQSYFDNEQDEPMSKQKKRLSSLRRMFSLKDLKKNHLWKFIPLFYLRFIF